MSHAVQPAVNSGGLAGAGRQYTAELWDGYDPAAMLRDPTIGHFDQVDFASTPCPIVATNLALANFAGGWTGFTGATASTVGPASIQGGVCELTSATDNMDTYLQRSTLGVVNGIGGRPYAFVTSNEVTAWPYHHLARIRFECRLAVSTVAANVQGWFVGFSGVLADNDLDDDTADVVTTKPFFGWSVLNGAAAENATPRVIYQNATAAPTALIANAGTMVANTWYTFGMDFDPMAKSTERCSFWFNGVKSSTFLTHAMTATNFPRTIDGSTMVDLAPSFMRKNGASTAGSLYISNFRVCQEFVGVSRGNEACG